MLLLIDENVPQSVTEFFRTRGHDVQLVREVLLPGTPDEVIAIVGNEIGAIVVTWNHADFRALVSRAPIGTRQRFRNLGRITFRCNESHGRARLEALVESIEFEYEQCQKRSGSRLIVEIGENYFRIQR